MAGNNNRLLISGVILLLIFNCTACHADRPSKLGGLISGLLADSVKKNGPSADNFMINAMLILPKNPAPGETFRIMATGGEYLREAKIIVTGPSGSSESFKYIASEGLPYWRIDDFPGNPEGKYKAAIISDRKEVGSLDFVISPVKVNSTRGVVWKTQQGWDSRSEALYCAWVNALFHGCGEDASWSALHEVTRNKNQNFLYNYLSLGEDEPDNSVSVLMRPDCADNPFFLRAYFSWKLGLPFGYHVCDRGYLGRNPRPGQWITNEISTSKTNPVLAFNSFVRRVADGVHSGTARTALEDEVSDYYPVLLTRQALRPGIVYADPYGHTLIIAGWSPQTNGHPGMLLSVDAQPDGTVGIKRFWKGNFLFNTTGVIGEPGFKAFRPILFKKTGPYLMQNEQLTASTGMVPFSLQQKKMETGEFYQTMERLINPKPLDPETALLDQIQALHEQLRVRVTSVANGEAYLRSHPGAVIPMPSSAAGLFQAGGQWEDFSTPNRDLRLLIAMDAVLNFPDMVMRSPKDYNISGMGSPEQARKKLQDILDRKVSELSISYNRSDGSEQKLTIGEILRRKDAFEMAYNPNDGIEIRWGAPENSDERSTCHRHSPAKQLETMRSVRHWFNKRLHPPT
ncbi:MAG: hypothetical protein IPN67_05245 [Bacteroidales bacterium]|nr:hypothetical protein [Bacteroidales bacterium]